MEKKDTGNQNDLKDKDIMKTSALSKINSVIMTPEQVEAILKKQGGGNKFSKIILRFSSKTLLTTYPTFELIAYRARKHKDYGSDAGGTTYLLKASGKNYPLTLNDDQQYIFGNNEIRTDKIEELAAKTGGGYSHLLFTAVKDDDNQVCYYVEPCDEDGTPKTLTGAATLEGNYTKPSPPAPPDPNV